MYSWFVVCVDRICGRSLDSPFVRLIPIELIAFSLDQSSFVILVQLSCQAGFSCSYILCLLINGSVSSRRFIIISYRL
ncbi:unnamed protein product [Brassica napus]|uniref:(rape) hypothetical protein n=1 Tax=Brassica napus TaxID=3708 RepID=A0A816VAX3_BRANA|nr:unnamed protein product [Brassica napus]